MTTEDPRDAVIDFFNTTIATMIQKAASTGDPIAFSSLKNEQTGQRSALVIATVDPKTIKLFEKALCLPSEK